MPNAASTNAHYTLQLFVIGNTTRSLRAVENLRRYCEARLPGRYDLEVVDIAQQPERARTAQVIAAPTLLRKTPTPLRRLIGDLSQLDRLAAALGVADPPGSAVGNA